MRIFRTMMTVIALLLCIGLAGCVTADALREGYTNYHAQIDALMRELPNMTEAEREQAHQRI